MPAAINRTRLRPWSTAAWQLRRLFACIPTRDLSSDSGERAGVRRPCPRCEFAGVFTESVNCKNRAEYALVIHCWVTRDCLDLHERAIRYRIHHQ